MKNVNQLDPETLASLRAAKQAQAQLRNMGLMVDEPAPPRQQINPPVQQPVEQENIEPDIQPTQKPDFFNVVKPLVTMSNDNPSENFVSLNGLPSGGLFYQTPIYGQPLKLEDIIQVQTMDKRNYPEKFNEVFARRIKPIQPEAILYADELYIALWLRANSFPESRHRVGGFTCSKCEFKMNDPEYSIGFEQIEFVNNKEPEVLFESYKQTGFIDTELSTGRKISVNLRRRYHDLQVYQLLNAEYYSKGKVPNNEYITLLKLSSLVDFEVPMGLKQKSNMVKNFEPKESIEFIKLLNKYSYSTDPVIHHTCPKCGEDTPLKGFPFRFEQYIPFD